MEPMKVKEEIAKKAPFSLEEMVDLRGKGVSLSQIGRMAGISKQAVSQRLKSSGLAPEEIREFTKDRSLILRGKQKLVLSAITPEKVKTMSVRDAAVAAGILIDKQRLIDGESTANVYSFTQVDLSLCQFAPSSPYQAAQLCTSCGTYAAGAESGLCETCRADITARKASTVPALPSTGPEGGHPHA